MINTKNKEVKISRFQEGFSSPMWFRLVEEIKERDEHKCTKCNSHMAINVYHKYIIPGARTWEVPKKSLTTLCNVCAKNSNLPANNFGRINKH